MNQQINVLSDADVILLKAMATQFRKTLRGTEVPLPEDQRGHTEDCYLAKASSPIAARAELVVSSAGCALWRIANEDDTGECVLEALPNDPTRYVYNPFDTAIAADTYFPVVLTKQGRWVPTSSESASSYMKHLCRFVLLGDLTTADAFQDATMTHEYGEGESHISHQEHGHIIVENLETHDNEVYEFYGDAGNAGLAYYNYGSEDVGTASSSSTATGSEAIEPEYWVILNMECP